MKTFLHYTKEQELDEGRMGRIMGRLGGMLGSTTRGLDKVGQIASISRQAFSGFEQGAKPGDALRGFSDAAGSIADRAEKSREGQENLDNMLIDAEDDLENYKRKYAKARTSEDKDYYKKKIDQTEKRLKTLAKVKKPSDLKGISRAASSSDAAKIRAAYP
jgi:hypothetical protein